MQPAHPDFPASRDDLRTSVREHYGRVPKQGAGCCQPASGCCGASPTPEITSRALGYSDDEMAAVPDGSNLGLGCGNPTGIASLQPGQTVLDLGSGAGFDAFLAARAVGPTGRVIGVDMTPEMLQAARGNQRRSRRDNVEFRLGEIEHLPLADASVDVVLSNCVINLSPEKPRVFAEAFRVLKPGGRLAVSDVVALRPLPDAMRADRHLYSGCVGGAALVDDVRAMLTAAGFTEVSIALKSELKQVVQDWFPGRGIGDYVASANITAKKPA